MRKIKVFVSLFLFGVSCFDIGLYTASTFKYNQPIEAQKWIITFLSGFIFLTYFLIGSKKITK